MKSVIPIQHLDDIKYQGMQDHQQAYIKIRKLTIIILSINSIYLIKIGAEVYYLSFETNDYQMFLAMIFITDILQVILNVGKTAYLYIGDYRKAIMYIESSKFEQLEFTAFDYQSILQLLHSVQLKNLILKITCIVEQLFHFIFIILAILSFYSDPSEYHTGKVAFLLIIIMGLLKIAWFVVSLAFIKRKSADEVNVYRFKLCNDQSEIECCICLSHFRNNQLLIGLPCSSKHYFHHDCIIDWLQQHSSCPMCKMKIDVNNIELEF